MRCKREVGLGLVAARRVRCEAVHAAPTVHDSFSCAIAPWKGRGTTPMGTEPYGMAAQGGNRYRADSMQPYYRSTAHVGRTLASGSIIAAAAARLRH